MMMRDEDYEVGYRKPPKHTQFQPGQSGNRNGRPKANKTDKKTMFNDVLNRTVRMSINGKIQRKTALEAIFLNVVDRALKGEASAYKWIFNMLREFGYLDKDPLPGTYGVMRVRPPMTDGKAWSERAKKNQRRAEILDRQGSEESPPKAKPKMLKARVVKAKKPST